MKDDKSLGYFLNKFVQTVNSHMLREGEAGNLLVNFSYQKGEINKWKLKKGEYKPQLLRLIALYQGAYPNNSSESRLDMLKTRVKESLTESQRMEIERKEEETFLYEGEEMEVYSFILLFFFIFEIQKAVWA